MLTGSAVAGCGSIPKSSRWRRGRCAPSRAGAILPPRTRRPISRRRGRSNRHARKIAPLVGELALAPRQPHGWLLPNNPVRSASALFRSSPRRSRRASRRAAAGRADNRWYSRCRREFGSRRGRPGWRARRNRGLLPPRPRASSRRDRRLGDSIDIGSRSVHRDIHVGELALDQLKLADRLAELFALVDIGHDNVHRGLHDAKRAGREHRALIIEARSSAH